MTASAIAPSVSHWITGPSGEASEEDETFPAFLSMESALKAAMLVAPTITFCFRLMLHRSAVSSV